VSGWVVAGDLPFGPWGVLRLSIDNGDALVDFVGDRWHPRNNKPFRVESLPLDTVPWLRGYLKYAAAALADNRRLPPSPDVLLEIARLRLVLFDLGGVDQAVRDGLRLLWSRGTGAIDRERLTRLSTQLSAFKRDDAITAIRSFLDDLPG